MGRKQETSIMKRTWPVLLALMAAAAAQGQLSFITNGDNTITTTGYTGAGGVVNIPSTTKGLPVTIIGEGAFMNKPAVSGVTIPGSVTGIGMDAFAVCSRLTNVMLFNSVPPFFDPA